MAIYDNTYSRFVVWLKIILPLIALGLLSTMFLLSRQTGPSQTIPYSTVEVEEIAREQRIGAPNFSGVTLEGAAVSVGAETAKPDPDNAQVIAGTALLTTIETVQGVRFDLTAASGTINAAAESVMLGGGVEMTTSTGYTVKTETLSAALDEGSVTSETPVTAEGPVGALRAGSMTLSTIPETNGEYLLVFKDGVKLIYDPKE